MPRMAMLVGGGTFRVPVITAWSFEPNMRLDVFRKPSENEGSEA
jgi:hypothetical protein